MKWLNPETGELERRPPGVLHSYLDDYNPYDPAVQAAASDIMREQKGRLPASVRRLLDLGKGDFAEQPKASSVTWRDVLTPRRVLAADGVQVASTTSETIMCPDFTFAADYMEVGDAFKYTLLFSWSSVITAPGTFTFRLRWGGVGGTALCTSGAFAPDVDAGSTSLTGKIEYDIVVRSIGTAGSMFAIGQMWPGGDWTDNTVAGLVANLNMVMIPSSAPAAVGSLDTTTAKALSPTVTFTVNGATTNLTTHIARLESLN
jgi:hypothetical protein